MTDAHAVARDQLRSFIERIERLECEKKTIADDIKDVKAEAKGCGFDVGTINAIIKLRKVDANERAERDALLDTYMIALGMLPEPAEEDYDQETGEVLDGEANAKLIATVATGMQTEIGRKALVAALDIMIEREEEEERRSDLGLNIQTKHEDIRTAPVTATESPRKAAEAVSERTAIQVDASASAEAGVSGQPEMIPATSAESAGEAAGNAPDLPTNSEKATVATQGEATAPTSDERETDREAAAERVRAAANAGGGDVDGNAERATHLVTGEGAACALPTNGITMEYVPASGVKRLPFAHCFPELSKADYERLERDIAANRVQTAIIRRDDVIIDGWARYMISRQYGMSYPVIAYTGSDVLLDVIEWQRASRNFTPAQEKKIAADLAKEIPHRADDIFAAFGLAEALEAAE